MFSDHVITLGARSFTVTSHDILMTLVSLVLGVTFWLALYFSRKRVVVLKRSRVSDDLIIELSRIAGALERLASQRADRAIAAATRRQELAQPPPPPQTPERRGVSYSMFGR